MEDPSPFLEREAAANLAFAHELRVSDADSRARID
jgi:hypothetical protein